ncbi:enoyl-CoA hydratase-related protein [Pokkaliibacter sp. CJK22405]|uniref:enoyl-CoA hydratase-related protein n=1 Tax=Pokkaliibacter sp. CJK22405 TaxID=3384615 RepID=UPI0039849B75
MSEHEAPQFQTLDISWPAPDIALLTLNRPKQLNALNETLLEELGLVLGYLEHQRIRVLMITGAGEKAFAAGADISQMQDLTPAQARNFSQLGSRVFAGLATASYASIALVNGFALGGGCELALACDMMLVSDKAKLGQPEVTLGVPAGFGGTQRLPRRVGPAIAMELLLTGRMINAEEALRIGLCNRVVEADKLIEAGTKLAEEIASKGPQAVRMTRELVHRGLSMPLKEACELESDLFALAFSTEDQKEGMAAFIEKRAPHFKDQ